MLAKGSKTNPWQCYVRRANGVPSEDSWTGEGVPDIDLLLDYQVVTRIEHPMIYAGLSLTDDTRIIPEGS